MPILQTRHMVTQVICCLRPYSKSITYTRMNTVQLDCYFSAHSLRTFRIEGLSDVVTSSVLMTDKISNNMAEMRFVRKGAKREANSKKFKRKAEIKRNREQCLFHVGFDGTSTGSKYQDDHSSKTGQVRSLQATPQARGGPRVMFLF